MLRLDSLGSHRPMAEQVLKAQTAPELDGLREASSARRERPPHSGSYARMRATPQCAAYRSPAEGGISSAGRAPALQAGGRRFDPVILHQLPDRGWSGET